MLRHLTLMIIIVPVLKTRNKLNTDLKNAKSEYYQSIFSSVHNDPPNIWETVNTITDRKRHVQGIQNIDVDGKK